MADPGAGGRVAPGRVETGELMACRTVSALSRRGRKEVRVRVVGDRSLGWIEVAEGWGARIEAVVHGPKARTVLERYFSHLTRIDVATAYHLPPREPWNGLVFATMGDEEDAEMLHHLLGRWNPLITIIAVPSHVSRTRRRKWLKGLGRLREWPVKHQDLGGVTEARCCLAHLTRDPALQNLEVTSLMTAPTYQRPLQTALDDTEPGGRIGALECGEASQGSAAGAMTVARPGRRRAPIYDGAGCAPDVSQLDEAEQRVWVLAQSVWRKERVVRQILPHELLSLWDYEGKLESRRWDPQTMAGVVRYRLQSPPAKVLRAVAYPAFDHLLTRYATTAPTWETTEPESVGVGRTADVPRGELEKKAEIGRAAATADGAGVDLSVWAPPGETGEQAAARERLRALAVRWWAFNVEKDAEQWLKNHPRHTNEDAADIVDCVRRAKACSYWEWHRGSRIMWFRLPEEWQSLFRDGPEMFHWGPAPRGFTQNNPSESREVEIEVRKKLFRLKFRGYSEMGRVDLVQGRFSITKVVRDGEVLDIRVVFNSRSNGYNETIWVPSFMLPTWVDATNMVCKWLNMPVGVYLASGSPAQDYTDENTVFRKSDQADIDVGEMFLNFMVNVRERHALGIRHVMTESQGKCEETVFRRFNRLHFGGKGSPYFAYQGQVILLDICKGDRKDEANPFHWQRVHCNLPASLTYDTSMPRVMKLRGDGELACGEATFVDDIHLAGRRQQEGHSITRRACQKLKSEMNHRGNQADDRKYRDVSLTPGPWNGGILHTDTPFPLASTTGKKWTKFRTGLEGILDQAQKSTEVATVGLRRTAGLGVHLTEIYPEGRSYLKGNFNALEAWRGWRDVDGWRLQKAVDSLQELEMKGASHEEYQSTYPKHVRITDELVLHVTGLLLLFHTKEPLAIPIRPTDRGKIRYHVGDASAEGFAAGTQYPDLSLEGRDGLWCPEFAKGGSNLREAQNIVNHLLLEIRQGRHDGCEIWSASDNAVWSHVWHKGMSSAKHLFHLVLDLRLAAREHEVWIRMFHISGDRMIATGMDGRSRGNFDAGVSLGFDLRQFLPLNVSAFDYKDNTLEDWCKSWMGSDYSSPLEPCDWYERGHLGGVHVWSPAPAAALEALKQLARSRLKRPLVVTHVVLVQRLLWQEEWRRRFEKEMDFWFIMKPGVVWPHSALEPLLVGISFPLSRNYPWLVRQQRDEVVAAGSLLSTLSKTSHVQVGDYLRKLWACPRPLPSV